jgi:hypothetical protein
VKGQPGDVPAGTRKVRHDSRSDGIPYEAEDDWNARGRLLGRQGGRRTHRDHHVNLEANQLCGQLRQALNPSLSVANLEH